MQVDAVNGSVSHVSGHACKRGETYAAQEAVNPLRMVTAVVNIKRGAVPLSVKTRDPIPKKEIFACMKAIGALRISAPVTMGQVLIENVCGSGVPVVATKDVMMKEAD
jgi:CxxC motif-containing protein